MIKKELLDVKKMIKKIYQMQKQSSDGYKVRFDVQYRYGMYVLAERYLLNDKEIF